MLRSAVLFALLAVTTFATIPLHAQDDDTPTIGPAPSALSRVKSKLTDTSTYSYTDWSKTEIAAKAIAQSMAKAKLLGYRDAEISRTLTEELTAHFPQSQALVLLQQSKKDTLFAGSESSYRLYRYHGGSERPSAGYPNPEAEENSLNDEIRQALDGAHRPLGQRPLAQSTVGRFSREYWRYNAERATEDTANKLKRLYEIDPGRAEVIARQVTDSGFKWESGYLQGQVKKAFAGAKNNVLTARKNAVSDRLRELLPQGGVAADQAAALKKVEDAIGSVRAIDEDAAKTMAAVVQTRVTTHVKNLVLALAGNPEAPVAHQEAVLGAGGRAGEEEAQDVLANVQAVAKNVGSLSVVGRTAVAVAFWGPPIYNAVKVAVNPWNSDAETDYHPLPPK